VQAYSAGLLEGSLSWQLIYWHWQNTMCNICEDQIEFCKHVRSFIEINFEKIKDLAEKKGDSDPFWHQVWYRELHTYFCCISYCNVLIGSISRWNFIALKVQYTTVKHSQRLFYNSNTHTTDSQITMDASVLFRSSNTTAQFIPNLSLYITSPFP
jgi:hypothetical protein